eukprot:561535-Prymnesium_polylepis.1
MAASDRRKIKAAEKASRARRKASRGGVAICKAALPSPPTTDPFPMSTEEMEFCMMALPSPCP